MKDTTEVIIANGGVMQRYTSFNINFISNNFHNLQVF